MTTPFPPGQAVTLNGMQMYYVLAGRGEPLVLLHGYAGSSKDWALFFDDLAKEYQLVIPDLRGHGRSTNPSKEYTYLWIIPNGEHVPIFSSPIAPFVTAVLPFLRGEWEQK